MGNTKAHDPVLLVMAVFSRYGESIDWARQQAERTWGPLALESPRWDFTQTDFYEAEMGTGLVKMLLAFERLIDPQQLADIKLQSNQWETTYQQTCQLPETRPLNLDPGYVSEAKLVLATTKYRDHRLYLQRGIYAEVTLHYYHRKWTPRDWTYPDYRSDEYHLFLDKCRDYLRQRLRQASTNQDAQP